MRIVPVALLFAVVLALLLFVAHATKVEPPTPSLPHHPKSESWDQENLLKRPNTEHVWCDGHVKEVVKYPNGDFDIVCKPAELAKP